MIHYISFASSSDGNAGLVTDGSTHILLDAGISARRLTQGLRERGLAPSDLDAVLLTHNHTDHTRGLNVFLKSTSVPVRFPGRDFMALKPFSIGSLTITAFHTLHDAYPSCGFRIEDEDGVFGFATDLGTVTDEIYKTLQGVRHLVLESNYDKDMLQNGPYPPALKARIASDHGHLENPDCAKFLRVMAGEGLKKAALAHLSKTNNDPQLALSVSEKALADTACELYLLKREGLTEFC